MEDKPQSPLAQYACFDRSFRAELTLFILFVPALITLWVFAAYYYHYTGRVSFHLVNSAAFYTFMFLYMLFYYANYRRDSKFRMVLVDNYKVVKRGVHKQRTLNYADVTGVREVWSPFAGMRMALESSPSRESLMLSLRVHNGHEMVRRIFGALEERGLFFEGLAGLGRRFYDASRRFNVQQSLRAMYMPNLVVAITAAGFLNGVAALIFWERGLAVMIVWGFFSMLLQMAAYFVTERIHVKKLLDGRKTGEEEGGGEGRVDKLIGGDGEAVESFTGYYVMAGMIALLLGMVIGILEGEGQIIVKIFGILWGWRWW